MTSAGAPAIPVAAEPERTRVVDEWSSEPNLDLLRAFAVLCVVARHLLATLEVPARAWFQPQALGIFGVLIFFVHTSLVLMVSLERQERARPISQPRLYAAFLIRRIFRIYPLSIAAVLLVYFVLIPLGDPTIHHAGILVAADRSTLVANLLLVQDVAGRPSILAPLWSLPAEVQMYLTLPALYFLGQARGTKAILLGVWPATIVLAIVVWKLDLPLTVGRYAPCFVAGVLSVIFLLRARRPLPFVAFPPALLAGAAVYMGLYSRIGLQAGLGIGATAALALLLPRFARMRSRRLRTASHVVAKYSYGIYLFHAPCIWVAFGKLAFLGTAGSMLALVVLIAATASAAYHLLEAPMIRVGQTLARSL